MASTLPRSILPVHTHFGFLWIDFIQSLYVGHQGDEIQFWNIEDDLKKGGWDVVYEDIVLNEKRSIQTVVKV